MTETFAFVLADTRFSVTQSLTRKQPSHYSRNAYILNPRFYSFFSLLLSYFCLSSSTKTRVLKEWIKLVLQVAQSRQLSRYLRKHINVRLRRKGIRLNVLNKPCMQSFVSFTTTIQQNHLWHQISRFRRHFTLFNVSALPRLRVPKHRVQVYSCWCHICWDRN